MSNASETPAPAGRDARIGPLANLPVFFKLDGKRVVVAGGGGPALWKAELLSATGAIVEVFAATFDGDFYGLAATPPGKVLLVERPWASGDLRNAALAVGSFEDDAEAAEFASAAREAGVPVNIVDRPAFCDFQFGAIVNRSPLVVGISTDGAAPVFGQAIRSMIEGLLPESFSLWANAARDLRREGSDLGSTAEKRSFWQRFTDFALRPATGGPTQSDIDQLMAGAPAISWREPVTVIEVGDDADALTLAAIRALRVADDIFFDEEVPAAVTDFARREARRHPVAGGQASSALILERLAAAAVNGRVVRLCRVNLQPERSQRELIALYAIGLPLIVLSSGAARSKSPPSDLK